MPEMYFDVTWPNGRKDRCYSPSRIIEEHFRVGASYGVDDFLSRSRTALHIASERVRAKYGYYCSAAMDTLAQLEAAAAALTDGERKKTVRVDSFHRPAKGGAATTSTSEES